ncbi:LOW QUALITY PROTEIN: hemopexin [Odontesthes bonariensis]
MDAVAVNEEVIPYFFNGHHLFKGFHGKAELSNESFTELDDHHHLGHVDAAFRMHYEDDPSYHDRMFFFLDNKVFSYQKHKLEDGYPKDISEVFPGIPDHLDAAVECPVEDSVIFFKGDDIYHFNVKTKAVDEKEFKSMPNCTSAFYMEHYYSFHGYMFSKFDGEVHGIPKEACNYFMRCSKFSKSKISGGSLTTQHKKRCSRVHLDAITSDEAGNMYAFRVFMENFVHSWCHITCCRKICKVKIGEPHTHLDGYPKPVKDELGIEGPIDAAFVCGDHHIVHIMEDIVSRGNLVCTASP